MRRSILANRYPHECQHDRLKKKIFSWGFYYIQIKEGKRGTKIGRR